MPRGSSGLSWTALMTASLPPAAMPDCQPPASAGPVSGSVNAASTARQAAVRRIRQRAGVAVSRPMLVTVSVWLAGTTAEYSAVQHEGQQYWRNTMGAST